MKNKIMIAWAAAAVFTCNAWSLADSGANPAPRADNAPSARMGDQSGSGGGIAKDFLNRGTMSEKDFDAHFVTNAAEACMAETQLAKIALQKSENPQVKELAQNLVRDHEQAEAQLKQVAEAKGIAWPTQLNELGQAKVNMFERLTGPGVDRHFVFGTIGEHVTAILWFRTGTEMLSDPQLKQWAEQTLPTLHHELREARRLAGAEEAQTAGARIQGDKSADTPAGQNTKQPSDAHEKNGEDRMNDVNTDDESSFESK